MSKKINLKLFFNQIPADRFHLVQKTGQASTALAFNPHRTTEFLVGLADNTIKCFDKGRARWTSPGFGRPLQQYLLMIDSF